MVGYETKMMNRSMISYEKRQKATLHNGLPRNKGDGRLAALSAT